MHIRYLPAAADSHYRPEVDGLRAVAVLAVIAHHFEDNLLPGGFLGVDIFFVISGYVITSSLINSSHNSTLDLLLRFYSRRVKRLVPALVVCVLVTSLLGVLFIDPETSDLRQSLDAGGLSLLGLSNIYFSFTARDYFATSSVLNLFTHTWSLGVEEQFYLVLPALFCLSGAVALKPLARVRFVAVLAALTALSFLAYVWLFRSSDGAYFSMPLRFWELSIGCLIAVLFRPPSHELFGAAGYRYAPWLASACLALALLAPADMRLWTTPLIVLSTAALIFTLRPKHPLFRLLTLRAVLLVGLMSYSLYLWHWSVLSISRWTVGVDALTAPFQLALILALGAASFFLIERPLRRAEWAPNRLVTVALGLVAVTVSLGAVFALRSNAFGPLFAGARVEMIASGVDTLKADKWHAGRLQWKPQDCVLMSNEDVGKEITPQKCSIDGGQSGSTRRFVVVGNSFATAEHEMYTVLSEEGLGSLTVTASWGASAVPEMPNTGAWSKANAYYWDAVVPRLVSPLSAGDFLIIVFDVQSVTPLIFTDRTKRRLVLLKTGLQRLSRQLREKGVHIVFQASIPNIRRARCVPFMARPQWFHFGRPPPCSLFSRTDTMARRQPLLDVLQEVQGANWNFHILDLFPMLCAGDICGFFSSDMVPLYRDMSSHPSVEANYLARPVLLNVVKQAIAGDASRASAGSPAGNMR